MRTLGLFALLAATAAYVLLHPPEDLAAGCGMLRACPVDFDAWSGSELSFEDAVVEELRADDMLVRRYERGGQVVWLTVVHHQSRRYGAHDPRVCYESQGYAVEPLGHRRVGHGEEALTVSVFRAVRPRERRLVYYWWVTGGRTTPDAAAMRRLAALAGAVGGRPGGTFVRVETRLGAEGEVAGAEALDDFSARVARALPGVLAPAQGRGGG